MDVHEVKVSQKDKRLQARDAVDETSAFGVRLVRIMGEKFWLETHYMFVLFFC